jgi:integrase
LLPEDERPNTVSAKPSAELGREALRQIYVFAVTCLSDPANPDPAYRTEEQVSQLKHVNRKSLEVGGPDTLLELSQSPEVAARLFTEPEPSPYGKVSRRWQTYRRFIETMVRPEEEAATRLRAIEDRLLPRQTRGWHQVERVGGGHRFAGRDRRLLFAVDLVAICSRAAEDMQGEAAVRAEALVSLCCWSGLRLGEMHFLEWAHLEWEQKPEGKLFPLWVRCRRRSLELHLPVHARGAAALRKLYSLAQRSSDRMPQGPVFRTLRRPYRRLSMRKEREILDEALEQAGFAGASALDLRAALADHLNTYHEVTRLELTEILGYGEHKHVRHLLEGHRSWRLNQKVDAAEARERDSVEEGHDEEQRDPRC